MKSIEDYIKEVEKDSNPNFCAYIVARDTYREAIFGVRSYEKNLGKDYGGTYFCQCENIHTTIPGERVKRYAETIYELLQRFVIRYKSHYKIYTKHNFEKLTTGYLKAKIEEGGEILGCIWTERGLTYVAKMNKDLDWELGWF